MAPIKTQINVQDQYLNRVRRDRSQVTIELTTGHKIEGTILGFDNFCIVVRNESDQLIYKHAISTLRPSGKFEFVESK